MAGDPENRMSDTATTPTETIQPSAPGVEPYIDAFYSLEKSESAESRVHRPSVSPAAPASSAPAARYVQVTNERGSSWGRKPR